MGNSSGLAGWTERLLGGKAANIGPDLLKLGDSGKSTFDAGNKLTEEGLNDLRGYRSTYASRLNDPLGATGRGIFTRARGALSDTANQRTSAFGSRLLQHATQSGGNLSPEAQAQLEQQNQRDVNQELFTGNAAISDAEAQLTLSETSKLFDRMESIGKTILGVGDSKSAQGLQQLFTALGLRFQRNAKIADTIVSSTGKISAGGGAPAQAPPTNTLTGVH